VNIITSNLCFPGIDPTIIAVIAIYNSAVVCDGLVFPKPETTARKRAVLLLQDSEAIMRLPPGYDNVNSSRCVGNCVWFVSEYKLLDF
jgi:hypothetical protein